MKRHLHLIFAALVALPGLFLGFVIDDYFHIWLLERQGLAAGLDLFNFASGDPVALRDQVASGPYPWFSLDELRLRFWRPLTGLLAWAEHVVFGRNPLPLHLHSTIWYLALVAVVAWLHRLLLPAGLALLAACVFAIDDAHAFVVYWIANRNALIALTLGLAGFGCWVRFRRDGWRPGQWAGPALLGLGLTGGEAALGAFGYVAAWELVGAREPRGRRILALLPVGAVGAIYVAWYKLGGYGSWGSAVYLDPTQSPGAWLREAPVRALAEAGNLILSAPVDLWMVLPQARGGLLVAGALGLGLLAWIGRHAWREADAEVRTGVAVLALGSAISLLPVLSTFPSGRLLLGPSVGSAAVIALVLHAGWDRWRGRRRGLAAAAGLLAFIHLGWSWLGWPLQAAGLHALDAALVEGSLTMALDESRVADQDVAVLAAPDPMIAIYGGLLWIHHGRVGGRTWWPLSMSTNTHRVVQVTDDAFELHWEDGAAVTTVYEQLFRDDAHPLLAGDITRLEHFTVEVLRDDGQWPTAARFTFDRALDDPSLVFLAWEGGRYQQHTWQGPGTERTYAVEPGPMSALAP